MLISLALGFKEDHFKKFKEITNWFAEDTIWRVAGSKLSGFISRDLLSIFLEPGVVSWSTKAFKYAVLMTQISTI